MEGFTDRELYELEYTLRKIPDKEKSKDAYELAMAICREIRERAAEIVGRSQNRSLNPK